MAILDLLTYNQLFGITDAATFNSINPIAEQIVNRATLRKIELFGFENFTDNLQAKIRTAIAHQVNAMIENGGLNTLTGESDLNASSVSIGRYSEQSGREGNFKGSKITQVDGVPISPMIKIQLYGTLLLLNTNRNLRLEDINEANP